MKKFAFIPVSEPVLQSEPPSGAGWFHEVKFDGFRIEAQVSAGEAILFSKNGHDFGARFRAIRDRVAALPVKSAIVDAELVASNAEGHPDFRALVGGQRQDLVLWCFDLLEHDGQDVRVLPLVTRRTRLKALLKRAGDEHLRFSDTFEDAPKLLEVCDARGLEGIVSKRADQPYVSGRNRGWIKVKCHAWRAAHSDRAEMFRKR